MGSPEESRKGINMRYFLDNDMDIVQTEEEPEEGLSYIYQHAISTQLDLYEYDEDEIQQFEELV